MPVMLLISWAHSGRQIPTLTVPVSLQMEARKALTIRNIISTRVAIVGAVRQD